MANFDRIFESILHHEGRVFTDFKTDRGGATKFGVTLATLQQLQPSATREDVEDLEEAEARDIYLRLWDEAKAEQLEIDQAAAAYYFDNYVNGGPRMANMTLQAAINHKLAAGDPSQWISVDGAIGNGTRSALNRVGSVSKLELKVQRSGWNWNNVLIGCRYGYRPERGDEPNRTNQEIYIVGWEKRTWELDDQGRTSLADFSNAELVVELKSRGYSGETLLDMIP